MGEPAGSAAVRFGRLSERSELGPHRHGLAAGVFALGAGTGQTLRSGVAKQQRRRRQHCPQHGKRQVADLPLGSATQAQPEEVVQMYIRKPGSPVARPIKDLRGFERVFVNKGQTRVVTMSLGPAELEYFDIDAGDYRVEKGEYEILVGSSSDDADLIQTSLLVR